VRRRTVLSGLAGCAVMAALVAGLIWVDSGGDAAASHDAAAAGPAPTLPVLPMPDRVTRRWSAPSTPPGEITADGSMVVVAQVNALSGRDARTGTQRWSYRRDNATLCGWTVRDRVVVAAFRIRHGCRDIVGLDLGTGARKWYRSGELGDTIAVSSAEGVVIFRGTDRLLAVDTGTGLNRWFTTRTGCTYGPLLVTNLGAVTTLTCNGVVKVVNHDAYADTEHWASDATSTDAVAVGVGNPTAVLGNVGGKPTLTTYDERGQIRSTLTDPRLAFTGIPTGTSIDGQTLVWTGRAVVGVDTLAHTLRWSQPALGPPRANGNGILLSEPAGYVLRSLAAGLVLQRSAADRTDPDTSLSRVGALVVDAGANTVTVYG
jgi:PQQ-like domain